MRTAKAVDRMFGVPLCFYWECRRECALSILQVWETACVSPVSFAGVWGNRRSWPVSHLCVLQVFGSTGKAGLCLTCVLCKCLEQQEKLACASPVCCAGVWSNRRSWPLSHLCVVQVFGATGEAGCVLLRVFRTAGEAGVLLSMPLVHLSPTCPVCFAGVQGTRSSKLTCVTSVPCCFFRC